LATPEDASVLAELGARTFRDTFAAGNTQSDMDAYLAQSFSPDVQSRELADPATTLIVASLDGQPVGYAKLCTGAAPACVPGNRALEIVRFYLEKTWVGLGLGGSLMHACLDHARRSCVDVVWLGVWEHNPRAIAFYKHWGFVVVGEHDFVLGADVQRDLLMARGVAGG